MTSVFPFNLTDKVKFSEIENYLIACLSLIAFDIRIAYTGAAVLGKRREPESRLIVAAMLDFQILLAPKIPGLLNPFKVFQSSAFKIQDGGKNKTPALQANIRTKMNSTRSLHSSIRSIEIHGT